MHTAGTYPDERQILDSAILLKDLMGDTGERPHDLLRLHHRTAHLLHVHPWLIPCVSPRAERRISMCVQLDASRCSACQRAGIKKPSGDNSQEGSLRHLAATGRSFPASQDWY